MFTVAERERVRDLLIARAEADPRVVSAAIVGSLVDGGGDEYSDIDLTFAVADGVAVHDVVNEWTDAVVRELDAAVLFDLPVGERVYRVFLLPGALQVDLSFAPVSEFRLVSPRFTPLFGTYIAEDATPPSAQDLFGWAITYAFHARASIERGKPWQAEHSITAVRHNGIALACVRRGLPARFGKGADQLPADVQARFAEAIVRSLEPVELRRALAAAVEALLVESEQVQDVVARVERDLRELASSG